MGTPKIRIWCNFHYRVNITSLRFTEQITHKSSQYASAVSQSSPSESDCFRSLHSMAIIMVRMIMMTTNNSKVTLSIPSKTISPYQIHPLNFPFEPTKWVLQTYPLDFPFENKGEVFVRNSIDHILFIIIIIILPALGFYHASKKRDYQMRNARTRSMTNGIALN